MYAFFVRHVSMAFSLWLVVTMQAILVVTVLMIVLKYILHFEKYILHTLFLVVFLSLGTGISYYTSQIMPDFLSGLVIICLGLLLCFQLPKPIRIFSVVLIIFSNMAHSSNLLTSTLIIVSIVILNLVFKKRFQIRSARIFLSVSAVAAGWLFTPAMNSALGAGFKVSRAPNVFIMGRLVESGVLNEYLHDSCTQKKTSLCNYMDHLPLESWHFLWFPESPLYDGGCVDSVGHNSDCWLVKNEQYRPVIKQIFSTPKYLKMYIPYAFKQTMQQLADFKNDPLSPMMEGSAVTGNIEWRFKEEYGQYIHSKQSRAPYTVDINTMIQFVLVLVCLCCLLICFVVRKFREKISLQLKIFTFVLLLGIFYNAAVCVTFSMVASRFQGRVVWLLVLATVLILVVQFRKRWIYKKMLRASA
jgi:hypothetical protein